ncbi:MAG: hypothetical protein J3K34DRAFT_462491 [Monoraphidium minutum]|nr:MAG: hypothetical protein J3K34DRAFT_462491 [Monoraphidium minutum]
MHGEKLHGLCVCMVVLALLVAGPPGAGAARMLLRLPRAPHARRVHAARPRPRSLAQYTDSMTGGGVDKSVMLLAATGMGAEAKSAPRSPGFAHVEGSVAAVAADGNFPRTRVSTGAGIAQNNGVHAGEFSGATFGVNAVSILDTGPIAGAVPSGMRLSEAKGTPGTSRGSTLETYAPVYVRGAGAMHNVAVGAAVGLGLPTARSFSQSEQGDGPHAISLAGEAVAVAFSSRFDVTNPLYATRP